MSWIRGTSTGQVNLSNDIRAACLGTSVLTVVVNAGGTGYTVGDILTFAGGTSTIVGQCEVTSVAAGVIDGIRMYNGGVYSVAATPTTANGVTGGTGSSATMDITNGTHGWISDRDTTWTGSQREVIMHGNGGGSDSIYIGWRTFENVGASRYNWELHGMTGFDDGTPAGSLSITQQPGVNPGIHDDGSTNIQKGAYIPLSSGSMNWYLSVTSYRIVLSVKAGSFWFQAYLGFINRFATTTEYPYPLCVAGSAEYPDVTPSASTKMSGLTDPIAAAIADGNMHLLDTSGTWQRFANATVSGSSLNFASSVNTVMPCGRTADFTLASVPLRDRWTPTSTALQWDQIIDMNGPLSAAVGNLEPTPGTVDQYVVFPAMLVRSTDDAQTQSIYGELEDVFWFSAFGSINSEDRIVANNNVYRVFVNCNRSGENYEFLAIKET